MRKRIGLLVAAALATAAIAPAPASAQTAPVVEIHDTAKLIGDGSVRVRVDVTCEPFGDVSENNIFLSQDGGAISAMRGIGSLRCNGRTRTYTVVLTPFDGAFHEGEAFASAFVSQTDSTTSQTLQGQDSETILVR